MLPTQCICVFCVDLRTNNDYFPIQNLLTGFYNRDLTLQSQAVTIYTNSLTFNNSTFCPHSVFMCFVWISEQTAIISLYSINWLVLIAEKECVYCAVRTECIYELHENSYSNCQSLRYHKSAVHNHLDQGNAYKKCVGHITAFTLPRPLLQTCFSSINIYQIISSLTQNKFWFNMRIVILPVSTSSNRYDLLIIRKSNFPNVLYGLLLYVISHLFYMLYCIIHADG
jgi:hypothetical protein